MFCFDQLSAGRPGGLVKNVVLPSNTTNDWLSLSSTPTTMRFDYICKNAKNRTGIHLLLRAPSSVDWFDASRRGKKKLDYPRGKNESTLRSGEGGGGPAMWPRIWVTTGRERESGALIIHGINEEKKCCKGILILLLPVNNMSVSGKYARHHQQSSL